MPEEARAAVSAAQLFEQLPSPDLSWLEEEAADGPQKFMESLRNLVGQIADAKLDRPSWVENELPGLLMALKLQTMMQSGGITEELENLEHDGLSKEFAQIERILADALAAFSNL